MGNRPSGIQRVPSTLSEDHTTAYISTNMFSNRPRLPQWNNIMIFLLGVAFLGQLTANLIFFAHYDFHHKNSAEVFSKSQSSIPLYATLGRNKPLVSLIEGYRNPIYASGEKETVESAWNRVNVGHGVVVLDTRYAMHTLGLPKGFSWEWDETKSTYIIAAYHAMHCVALIRGALKAGFTGEMTHHQRDHSLHCVDTLREEIMCTADRTILRPGPPGHAGAGMVRICTDWTKLRDWATRHSAGYMRAENGTELLNVYYPGTDGWEIM